MFLVSPTSIPAIPADVSIGLFSARTRGGNAPQPPVVTTLRKNYPDNVVRNVKAVLSMEP